MNDLFYFIKDAQLESFADENTISDFSNSVDDLIPDLQKESPKMPSTGFARTKW